MRKIIPAAALTFVLLIAVLQTVEASAPNSPDMYMGQGPMGDNDAPGPMNGRSEKDLGGGMMFRYGQESPEVSLGSGESTGSLNMRIESISFRNGTDTYEISPGNEEWNVEETGGSGEKFMYSYSSTSRWMKGGSSSDHHTDIDMDYDITWSESQKRINYSMELSNEIGEGELTIRYRFSLEGGDISECCMNSIGESPGGGMGIYDSDMNPLGEISQEINATVTTDQTTESAEIERSVEIINGTGILTVSMNIGSDVQSIENGGVISILDDFVEIVTEGVEDAVTYVLDHICSFAIGIGIIVIIVVISTVIFAGNRSGRDMSDELDLRKSPIYKGPRR